jgi:nucleoid-associated protein YgaU
MTFASRSWLDQLKLRMFSLLWTRRRRRKLRRKRCPRSTLDGSPAASVAAEKARPEAGGSSADDLETAPDAAPAKRALHVPKAEIIARMNAAKLRAPWLNDGAVALKEYCTSGTR